MSKYFQPWEFPRSGSKAKDGEKKKERGLNDGNNNSQLCIANATLGGARKPAWANSRQPPPLLGWFPKFYPVLSFDMIVLKM